MKVTMLLEGTYPYIQGGVSSWMHQMIQAMEDYEFTLVYIGGKRQPHSQYRYKLPYNVIEVREIYLQEAESGKGELRGWKKKERDEMAHFFLTGELPSIETIGRLRQKKNTPTAESVLRTDWAWAAVLDSYRTLQNAPGFSDFFWNWRSMWLPLLRLLRVSPPEGNLIYSPSAGYAGWYGAQLHRLTGHPLILTEHGIYAREREEEIIRAEWIISPLKAWWKDFFDHLSKVAYRDCTFLTTLSSVNQQAQISYGADSAKMQLIPNGIKLTKFAHITPTPNRSFTIGAILRVVPIKDVKTLIRAMAIVVTHIPEAKLMLMGPQDEDPEYFTECQMLIESLGIGASCVWTGPVNILEYMPNLDCIVLTSISEGQPLVLLEAMAAGLPCVTTDVGACRELMEGLPGEDSQLGRCGFVTKLMTPGETGTAIMELARNPELRAEMGRIGRERVARYYQFVDVIKKYRDLFEEAVGGAAWPVSDLHYRRHSAEAEV
jgi:glycosyltransferase involved in cell wall biosynthesis